jgi:hypothetical protein
VVTPQTLYKTHPLGASTQRHLRPYSRPRSSAARSASTRWCDVFEIRDWKIQRCVIYLDPDYAGMDTERYPWLANS